MKIGIVWENGVSKWAMSPFEPLMKDHEVYVFVGENNKFDHSMVELNKIHLNYKEEYLLALKQPIKSIKKQLSNPYKKMDFYFHSLSYYIDDSFDIIISSNGSRALATLAEIKKEKRFKLVQSNVDNIPFCSVYDDKTEFIKEKYFDSIDLLIPWCKSIESSLLQEGISKDKIKTVYEGVNTNIFYPKEKDMELVEEFNLDENKFTFSYIGKLSSIKGVQYILYAANILKQKGYTNFQITITGSGAQKSNLEKIIKKANLEEYITFTGFVEYTKIARLFSLADVLILPTIPTMTIQEQYGMVIVESLACNKPVIGSKSGSIAEIIDNAGLVYTPGNWNELADRMIEIMSNEELYKQLSHNAEVLTKTRYSIDVTAKTLQEALESLCEN